MRQTISAAIIAKNEETMLANCLASVSFCDEIILVDGGSSDSTCEIAKKYRAKIIFFPSGNFANSRNKALENASSDWILYIDADERISKQLLISIKTVIASDNSLVAYKLLRKNFYFKTYEWPKIEKLERLFLRKNLKKWYGALHESPRFSGKVGELQGNLLHYTHRDLSSMLMKTLNWSSIEAQNRFDAHHPRMTWWRFPRVMLTAFIDSYVRQGSWKVGVIGLIESLYQAYSAFVTYAKLWELQHEVKI